MVENTTPVSPAQPNPQAYEATKWWSWAGSFFTMGTLIAARKIGLFIANFITMCIPFFNILAFIIWFIYGGLKGKEIIYNSDKFDNHDEKIGAIKALENIGFVFFIFFIITIMTYGLIFILKLVAPWIYR